MPNIAETDLAPWGASWAWGLPLILLTVVIHVFGLAMINDGVIQQTVWKHWLAAAAATSIALEVLSV